MFAAVRVTLPCPKHEGKRPLSTPIDAIDDIRETIDEANVASDTLNYKFVAQSIAGVFDKVSDLVEVIARIEIDKVGQEGRVLSVRPPCRTEQVEDDDGILATIKGDVHCVRAKDLRVEAEQRTAESLKGAREGRC